MDAVERTNPHTLAFLAPGLLHQFGNVFLSIQGNALGFTADTAGRERDAVCAAAARGAACLDVLRFLAGEPMSRLADVASVLDGLAEIARVPVRETNQTLAVRHPAATASMLADPAHLVVLTAEAMARLSALVPRGVQGVVVVEWSALDTTGISVQIRFEPNSGTLPFPLAVADLPGQVGRLAEARRSGVVCGPLRAGVALRVPAQRAARSAEA